MDLLPVDNENKGNEDFDVKSIACSVMSESTMGSIHSRKSLANLLDKAKERMESNRLSSIAENGEGAVPPPHLITHTDDDGARLAEKNSLNKLPFKNRNPAL